MRKKGFKDEGFTLLELMVAMIILAVGIVGFAGMSVMMAHGTRTAKRLDEASTLLQSAVEDLSAVTWDNLGTNTTLPADYGLQNANVRTEGPINKNAQPLGTGSGPYSFYRHTVICTDTDTVATGTDPTYCGSTVGGTKRPTELTCDTLGLNNREKMIRVLISWTDRAGKCHRKAMDSLQFQ